MKTIQAPNGKCYEVDDIWQPMETRPKDGEYYMLRNDQHIASNGWLGDRCIAWMPVPTIKEVQPPRWRAGEYEGYWSLTMHGIPMRLMDDYRASDDALYAIGNYFRTDDDARNSNKFRVMNDPNSEAAE
jgi:hypothetical protein